MPNLNCVKNVRKRQETSMWIINCPPKANFPGMRFQNSTFFFKAYWLVKQPYINTKDLLFPLISTLRIVC